MCDVTKPKQSVESFLCPWCILIDPMLSQVPPQPLWFAPGLANIRKLQELPYHLLHSGLWEELRQEVISKTQQRGKWASGPCSLPLFSAETKLKCVSVSTTPGLPLCLSAVLHLPLSVSTAPNLPLCVCRLC